MTRTNRILEDNEYQGNIDELFMKVSNLPGHKVKINPFTLCARSLQTKMATIRSTARGELYFFTNFAFCISLSWSLLNLEELKSIKYGVEISNEPVLLREVSFQSFCYAPMKIRYVHIIMLLF